MLLRVFVTVAGDAVTVELKQSSGFPRLDKAAQEAVQAWTRELETRLRGY